MDRPYVVCHMLASVDGKIDGDYMRAPECSGARSEYGNLRNYYALFPIYLPGITT